MASTASEYCGNISGSIIGVKITPQIEIQADINIAKIFNFLLDFRSASSGNKNLKITHDHHVALPSTLKNGCHFWNKCSGNNIYNFEPDYIFFDSTWTYMGKPHEATDILNIYVKY